MKQSGAHIRHSSVETAKVKCVKFTLLGKEEIQRWTVCEVSDTRLYNGRTPTHGGLNDLRMGVSSMDQQCLTCGEIRECPGHFGRIKLQEPIYHYGYLKFVEKVMKCICHKCSRLRKPKQSDKRKFSAICSMTNSRKKLIALSKILVGVNKCEREQSGNDIRGCGSSEGVPTKVFVKNYKICVQHIRNKKNKDDDDPEQINHKTGSDKVQAYSAQLVCKILQKIDANDARIMGFTDSKPVNLILTELLICPPQVRPSIEMNPQKRAEDTITSVYNKILYTNNQLKKNSISDNFNKRELLVQLLEKSVASIMKKADRLRQDDTGGTRMKIKQGNKVVKSFEDRLKGKEGRFRQHLMGKRVDFSARSVISPDANLCLDELGVPQKVAASLTFPEQVTALNIDRIRKLCEQGKVLYFLKPSQDRKKYQAVDIKEYDFEKELNCGIVVERCLQDGDFVLFNRQPTLHRMSMMGHRVRILPYNTFRLNLSVCTPYNADFDGDEMNMHVPQSYQTLAEIKHIAHVSKQIITPKNNAPVMGIVQDSLLGIYLFTLRDTFLTREQIMNLVIWIDSSDSREDFDGLLPGQLPMPAILKPVPLWTGKQVMSMVIPSKISSENYKDKTRDNIFRNPKDVNMIIRKGELITGAMQKEIVGSGAGGLIHIIWLQIGPDATNHFITTTQRVVNNWLMQNSFSVGAADIVPTLQCDEKIRAEKLNIQKKYEDLVFKFRNQESMKKQNLHMRGKTITESLEFHINEHLNAGLGVCQKIVTSCISPYNNNIYKMIFVKSKGNETNLCQIIGVLANQNVDGRRPPEGFTKRALPHFNKYDMSPEPRGFIYNSFFSGLKSHEFFFHSMGGREGLSDTAVKTSRTGYIQRKLIKALEDVVVKYDGTVRDSQNNIVQRLYGEDGFAAEFIQKQNITYDDTMQKFEEKFKWDEYKLIDYKVTQEGVAILEEEFQLLIQGRKRLREIFLTGMIKDIYCPIRVDRLINNFKVKSSNEKNDLSPTEVVEDVERLLDVCIHPRFEIEYRQLLAEEKTLLVDLEDFTESKKKEISDRKKMFQKESGIELFRIIIRMALSSKAICETHKLNRLGFKAVVEMIKAKFRQSMIHPGEAIGAIAAQCVGEPTTQMTLNTFHSAGIAATNVTLGVPRLQELLDVSKKMKTPSLKIYLKDMVKADNNLQAQDRLQKYILYEIPQRHLSDYIVGSKIFYDYALDGISIGANNEGMLDIPSDNENSRKKTPWVLALYFDKQKKIVFSEVWDEVKKAVQDITNKEFEFTQVNSFNDNSETLEIFLRCYEYRDLTDEMKKFETKDKTFDYFRYINDFEIKIRRYRISGIDSIKKVLKLKEKIPIEQKGEVMSEAEYWILQTEGSNLKAILSHPAVDSRKTFTNDMTEILEVLGIEAARMSFINEFRSVLKHYSIYINYRHLATLSDWMTRRGSLTPINRNGINRISDVSILRKASFEETVEILYDAAVFSQIDPLKGISQKIVFGQSVEIGTGSFPIMLDRSKVKDFKIQGNEDIKDHIRLETQFTNEESAQNTMGTPNPMGTPWGPWGGNTNLSMGTPNRAVSFSPNPYATNRFTSEFHPEFGAMSSRSPGMAYGATPMVPMSMRGGEYTPNSSTSPTHNTLNSPYGTRIQSPLPGFGYNLNNAQSPHYGSTVSPVYSSGHQRSNYNSSSRAMQSPRYQSPFSNAQSQSRYSNSPSYSASSPIVTNQKQEDNPSEDEEDK